MNKPKIIAYLKPQCGWSRGVRAVMQKYNLEYEDRDIINDPAQREEMMVKSGQPLSPCVEINGTMLADVSGEEVETYMLREKLIEPVTHEAAVPTNQGCSEDEHVAQQTTPVEIGIRFRG